MLDDAVLDRTGQPPERFPRSAGRAVPPWSLAQVAAHARRDVADQGVVPPVAGQLLEGPARQRGQGHPVDPAAHEGRAGRHGIVVEQLGGRLRGRRPPRRPARRVPGSAGQVASPVHTCDARTRSTTASGVRKLSWTKGPKRLGEAVFALDDDRGVRDRQAERARNRAVTANQSASPPTIDATAVAWTQPATGPGCTNRVASEEHDRRSYQQPGRPSFGDGRGGGPGAAGGRQRAGHHLPFLPVSLVIYRRVPYCPGAHFDYRVAARNPAVSQRESHPRRRRGPPLRLSGGLVPGVTVYGYACHAILAALGPGWVEPGRAASAWGHPATTARGNLPSRCSPRLLDLHRCAGERTAATG